MDFVFDIDGVISNYDFGKSLKKHLGIEGITNSDLYCYDTAECLGIPEKDINYLFTEMAKEPLNIVPRVFDVLEFLQDQRHQVIIYTSRYKYSTEEEIENKLSEVRLPYDFLTDKIDFKVDASFDDYPKKLLDLYPYCRKLYLYRQPWNSRCLNVNESFEIVKNWDEIYGVLRKDFGV